MPADVALPAVGGVWSAASRSRATVSTRGTIRWLSAETLGHEVPALLTQRADAIAGVRSRHHLMLNIPAVEAAAQRRCSGARRAAGCALNIVPGNPDEGRAVASKTSVAGAAAEATRRAIPGAPTERARRAPRHVCAASDDGGAAVERLPSHPRIRGKVTFAGKVASARAPDYAVVRPGDGQLPRRIAVYRSGDARARRRRRRSLRAKRRRIAHSSGSCAARASRRARGRAVRRRLAEPSATLVRVAPRAAPAVLRSARLARGVPEVCGWAARRGSPPFGRQGRCPNDAAASSRDGTARRPSKCGVA